MNKLATFLIAALLYAPPAFAQLSGGSMFPGPGTVHSAGGGGGTVTVDAKSAAVTTCTTSPCTVSLTLGGSATAVEVLLAAASSLQPVGLAATWNGTTATLVPNTSSGTHGGCSCYTAAFAQVSPTTGAHSFSITYTGVGVEIQAVAISFIGTSTVSVAAAFPNGTQTVQDTATASPITTTVTSATGHIVPAFASQQSSAWGTINGTTIATEASGPTLAAAGNYNSGATTVTPSFAFTGPGVQSIVANDVSP